MKAHPTQERVGTRGRGSIPRAIGPVSDRAPDCLQVKKLTEEQIDSLMLSYKEMLQSAKGHEFGVSAASCTTFSAPF